MSAEITSDKLRQLVPDLPLARALLYADALEAARGIADLKTDLRVAHFMAQIAHESGGLGSLVESTAYTNAVRLDKLFKNVQGVAHAERLIKAGKEAIGNTIYAYKLGNGGPESGDGYRYRGRGFMMITGRSNYKKMGELAGLPLVDNPELLGKAEPAAQAAAYFWKDRKINLAADVDAVTAVTELVNGPAKLHLAERKAYFAKARQIWSG